jgi:hypothetical protein
VIESLHQEVGLLNNEIHRLIIAVTNLFKIAAYVNFEEERLNNILSQRLE